MPLHTFSQPKGRLEFFETEAHPLLTNMLGDPISRTVGVYVPEVCRADERYPVLIDLAGFTGSGLYDKPLPDRRRESRHCGGRCGRHPLSTDHSDLVNHLCWPNAAHVQYQRPGSVSRADGGFTGVRCDLCNGCDLIGCAGDLSSL